MKIDTSKIKFEHWRTLVPYDRTVVVQDFTQLSTGEMIISQDISSGRTLRLTRFGLLGKRVDTFHMAGMGHGDRLASDLQDRLILQRHSGGFASYAWGDPKGKAVKWPVSLTPAWKRTKGRWFQGEENWHGLVVRNWGCPYVAAGPEYPHQTIVKPHLQLVHRLLPAQTVPLTIGRDTHGHPNGGKLENEGIGLVTVDGHEYLGVGVCTGRKGHYALEVYITDLAAAVVD